MTAADDRRQRRSFEPPPWESEQYEELERKRRVRGPEPSQPIGPDVPGGAANGDAPVGSGESAQSAAGASVQPEGGAATAGQVAAESPGPDDARMDVMLMQLREQEPRGGEQAWRVGLIAAIGLAVTGAILVVWGAVGLATTYRVPAGWFGASVLLLFGALFIGAGGWVAVRSYRQRGAF